MRMSLTPAASLTLLVTFLALTTRRVQGINSCDYDAQICGCQTDKGPIDLKRFAGKQIKSGVSSAGQEFFWSPCGDFTKGSTTAACIQGYPDNPGSNYDCGQFSNAKSTTQNGEAVFKMDSLFGLRHSTILCRCKSGDTLRFMQENPTGNYNLEFDSDACCPGASGAGGGAGSGLSAGSILLIVMLCVIVVYVVAGVIVQVGIKKAEGRERIPNVALWTAIPGLIKDGVRFTFSRGKATNYDQI